MWNRSLHKNLILHHGRYGTHYGTCESYSDENRQEVNKSKSWNNDSRRKGFTVKHEIV
jgi:hypothetical protein